jgi:hypothetical protein
MNGFEHGFLVITLWPTFDAVQSMVLHLYPLLKALVCPFLMGTSAPITSFSNCNSDLSRANRAFYATTGSFVTSDGACLPSRTASMLSRASMPIAKRVSTVALPMCGNRNVFLSATYPG